MFLLLENGNYLLLEDGGKILLDVYVPPVSVQVTRATSFSTITLLSFAQWLDHWLTDRSQAYFNTTTQLYYQEDTRLDPGNVAYASPFRSWVYDSGVNGAVVIDRISGSLGLGGVGEVLRGQSGLQIDYNNGRVILPASVGTNAIISGTYAVKEMNIYFANQSAERMVFTNKYYLNSRFARPITGIPPPYQMVTPCIFISSETSENKNAAFGGLYNTQQDIHLYVLAENLGQLEGVLSAVSEAEQDYFPQLPTYVSPLSMSGDIKSGYNYAGVTSGYGQPGNLFYISDVSASKVGDGVKIDQSVFLGVASLKIDRTRTIH